MTKDNHILGEFMLNGIPPAARGVPQIEVTFEVDADGILNVSACDMGTGKVNKITITNDKGRLSAEEIEKMVSDAEKFKAEDNAIAAKIQAKSALENYCYQMKNTLHDGRLKSAFSQTDKNFIHDVSAEGLQWLEDNQSADAGQIDGFQKTLENKFNPIMMRVYQQTGTAPEGL